jgi:protein-disulfide isomerase
MVEIQNPEKKSSISNGANKYLIPVAIVIAGIIIAGAVIVAPRISLKDVNKPAAGLKEAVPEGSSGNSEEEIKADVFIEGEPLLGDPNAPVTIIEFSDFQCPFCAEFDASTFPQIKKEYVDTGKAKVVFKNFPLSFHQFSQSAAEAGECAQEQGKFWEYKETLFENQENLSVENLKKYAKDLGLDAQKFDSCLDSEKFKSEVENDFNEGVAAGIMGTPSFIVGSETLVGAQPFSEFQKAIEQELK